MRLAVVGWLAFAPWAVAQAPTTAVVRVPSAEVRGGKSSIFPVTGFLRQYQPVQILKDEGDFYAIAPPSGSSSWVMDRGITYHPAASGKRAWAAVNLDDMPVLLGSPDANRPHAVETAKLKRGTIVFPVGEKVVHERAEWWRIEPVASESRYVAKDAVTPPDVASSVVNASPTSPPKAGGPNPLFAQAEEAERFGNCTRAEMLYRQLAAEQSQAGGDHELAKKCYARADALSRRAQPVLNTGSRPVPTKLANNPKPVSAFGSRNVTSGPGWLRRTGVTIDGRTAYALEDNQGTLRYYLLSAGPGLNLETFVNRPVDVTGNMVQRTDMSGGGYVAVETLRLLR